MSTELQRAAGQYAEKGFAIFPLRYRDKRPLTKNGLKDATSDPAVVAGWWEKWPEANIGLVTGLRNGIAVIDLDVDGEKNINGAESLARWQEEHGTFPPTLSAETGRGGTHLLYRVSSQYGNRVGILPGVDIRADGGYIVAPPSVHPNGNRYRWKDRLPMAELGGAAKSFLEQKPERRSTDPAEYYEYDGIKPHGSCYSQSGPHSGTAGPSPVPEGKRNDTMFRLACSLQAKGLSDSAVLAACERENRERFVPPLEEKELRGCVEGCLKRFRKGDPICFDAAGEAVQGLRQPDFQRDAKGNLTQTICNAQEAISCDGQLYGKIRYNDMAYAPYVTGALPWDPRPENFREWTDFDDSGLKGYIEMKYGLHSDRKCMEALNNVLNRNHISPVQDRLREIHREKWDGKTGHIASLLPDYLGVEDTEYAREAMKLFMLGAVSRAFRPGCKFDYMLVLVGEQGVGKSAFLRGLAMDGRWFSDNFNCIDGDKAFEKLRGMWIVEMAELLATKRVREQESIKAFLTSVSDTYRAPYGRRTEKRDRVCVFTGTTNDRQFLADVTGARRFLPLEARGDMKNRNMFTDRERFERDIEQAWGEAVELYEKAGGKPDLILPEGVLLQAEEIRDAHTEEDPRVGLIQDWLDRCGQKKICAVQLYTEALKRPEDDWTVRDINEIHRIMQNKISGWRKMPTRQRCGRYGIQFCYEPVPKTADAVFTELDNNTDELPF